MHLLATDFCDHVLIYIGALSNDLVSLRSSFLLPGKTLHVDFENERRVIDLLIRVRRDKESWINNQENLATCLGFASHKKELRVDLVMKALQSFPNDVRSADRWVRLVIL